ncbi:MAG: hypothetical protein AAGH99_05760 [Planctomycetota bacterium]
MQCNIDAKGKAFRLVGGFFHLLAAMVLATLLLTGVLTPVWCWAIVAGVAVGGAFMVFEGWSGWCVVRAMGFKTPF